MTESQQPDAGVHLQHISEQAAANTLSVLSTEADLFYVVNCHYLFFICYNQQHLVVFSWFCKTLRHYSLRQRTSGCVESKVDGCWQDQFHRLWIVCDCLSFCALHHQLKGLFASGRSFIFLLLKAGVLLGVLDNGKFPLWGFNLTGLPIEANFLCLLPLWLLQEEICFAFSLGNKRGLTFFVEGVMAFRDRAEDQSSPAGLEKASSDAMRRAQ